MWRSLVAHLVWGQDVAGSNPVIPTMNDTTGTVDVGRVGGMYAAGQVVATVTGRHTTPFPHIDVTTERRAINTLRRVDAWLIGNAVAEAAARHDRFAGNQFKRVTVNDITTADRDLAELYLFELPEQHPTPTR
jgi:hypothetical protein